MNQVKTKSKNIDNSKRQIEKVGNKQLVNNELGVNHDQKEPTTATKPEIEEDSKLTSGSIIPVIIILILFIISIGFALILTPIYINMGFQADFEALGGEESLIIPFFYLAIILIFTAVILFITRKRRGGLIKYAFLGVICLSMIYVFFAIFHALFYPIPPQKWSGEVDVEGGVSTLSIGDLTGDSEFEIIVGTNSGDVLIYDLNRDLLGSTNSSQRLLGTIHDMAVVDLNQNNLNELIILSGNVNIFKNTGTEDKIGFNKTWVSISNDYSFLIEGNRKIIIVGSYSDITGNIDLEVINYYNDTYYIEPFNESLNIGFPGSTIQEIINNFGKIIDVYILDIDDKNGAELVAWDDTGTIYIFENGKTEPYWEYDVGDHIGGVVFGDIRAKSNNNFENFDGIEMVVSVDGKVYIYYSDSDDDFLNERYVLTDEVGRLDRDATGLALGDLYADDEFDIIVGYEKGFKDYHYIPPTFSDIPCFMALIISVLLTLFLLYYPEWYLVDIVGIIVAAGVTALIGISIGLLPIIILLIILALYDAISVYKTRHMVSLADKVMEFKLPILLVVPKKRGYSFLRQKGLRKQLEDGEEREAMFVGLGDIIIPGTLVISAFHFLPATDGWFGISANLLVAIFTLIGILVGFSALMHFVMKGNPQAGLPLLNTGAILGFFISNFMLYQDITFGLALPFG